MYVVNWLINPCFLFRNNSFILLKSHHLNDEKMEQTGRLFCYPLSAKIRCGRDSIACVQSHPPLNQHEGREVLYTG